MIYISDDSRDSGEKDPTIQALGIRAHVYGARADLVIMDDCVDMTNAAEYEKQIESGCSRRSPAVSRPAETSLSSGRGWRARICIRPCATRPGIPRRSPRGVTCPCKLFWSSMRSRRIG